MTITAVSALNSTASTTSSTASAASTASISSSIGLNFTTYLQILTAQLQNQDPTSPTDPNQYTQELIQIEQAQIQNNTNTDLESLTNATSTNGLATGIGYINNYVQANSTNGLFALQNSSAEFGYSLPSAASSAVITVENSSGDTVAAFNGGTAAGGNYVTWNGQGLNGAAEPDGTYAFTVTAQDANGNTITSTNPVALFKVTSVQSNTDGSLQLLAGSLSLATTDVTDVYTAGSLPTATASSATQQTASNS